MSNACDMSELFAYAFSAVFVEGALPVPAQHQSFAGVLDEIYATPRFVTRVLSSLNSSVAVPMAYTLTY